MDKDYWYDCFLDTLYEKYPKKTQLVQELMNILSIEKEAAYRRLRKDVIFPFHEVIKIASAWDISLDQLVNSNFRKTPFVMSRMNYLVPTKSEFLFMQDRIQFLDTIKGQLDTEYVEVCNVLPKALLTGFPLLYQFSLFKWAYKYGCNLGEEGTFSEIILPENMQKLLPKHFRGMKNVASVSFICDHILLKNLIHDIRYFHSIRMVTDDEKELIKQELYAMAEYLEEVVGSGYYPETGNKVNLYISQIHVETNYSFLYTKNLGICRIHVFNKHDIYTYDTQMIDSFKTWVQLQKNSSILISTVDKRSRIDFFTNQRQLIDNL
jgi:hypothetical protein